MNKLFICVLLSGFAIFHTNLSYSQFAEIKGNVISNDKSAISDVKVFAYNGTDTAITNSEGEFKLQVLAGTISIWFIHEDYTPYSKSIILAAGTSEFIQPVLEPANLTTIGKAVITVSAKHKQNSVAGAIQNKALATQMIEAISAEDFKKTTIRTSGDALKRVPGATIMEGKFANIRGMYDRYNTGYLNGAPLPSTESDRKAFSFDVIPAGLLDNIMVIKSATPDLIGDFGGGIVKINTKGIPTKFTQSFNFGFQYNSITTFRNLQSFQASTSEIFGLPGKGRKIPQLNGSLAYPNPETNSRESSKFNNDWSIGRSPILPSPRFNYTLGLPFKLKNNQELGMILGINYSLTQKYSDGQINKFDLSDNRPLQNFQDQLFNTNVQNGGILNFEYRKNKNHTIEWKNLFTLNYDATTTIRSGVSDFDNSVYSDGYSNFVNFNRLINSQVNGTHVFGKGKTTVTWLANIGNTMRQVPDFRIAQYATFNESDRYLVTNDFFNAGSGRFFSSLNETTKSGSLEIKHNLSSKKLKSDLKYGLFSQQRNRDFNSREFVYGPVGKVVKSNDLPEIDLGKNNIHSSGLYLIEKTNPDLDEYTGKSSLKAGFIMLENAYPLYSIKGKSRMLKVIYGVRYEQFAQVIQNEIFTKYYKKDVSNSGIVNDILPSINIIAPVAAKSALRLSYYKTLNRPEMREMAPFSFYNFNLNSEIQGNTDLKRAVLNNYDVRYEFFPGKENMFSIGAFTKQIKNPIEFSLSPEQALIRTFTYENEKSARIHGMEVELRKSLNFIGHYFAKGLFSNMSFYSNFSLIRSSVQFRNSSSATPNRSLQGQSPYVVNMSLFYDNAKTGWNAGINFNKIGSRIAFIGVPGSVQPFGLDIYEFGRAVMDLQVGKQLGKSGNIKITVGDILAQKSLFYQDVNGSGKYETGQDNAMFQYTNGRTVSVSYGYSF